MANEALMTSNHSQGHLFKGDSERSGLCETAKDAAVSSTFLSNMTLPVHRWFRYSAGFSATWVRGVIEQTSRERSQPIRVFDPFAGSATTLLASQAAGMESWGTEAHPFVFRIAHAKTLWDSDAESYRAMFQRVQDSAARMCPETSGYPELIYKCYSEQTLARLDALRRSLLLHRNDSPSWELAWLTLIAVLRKVSTAGTAQWQYILPNKPKKAPLSVDRALLDTFTMIYSDMLLAAGAERPAAHILQGDARTCEQIESDSIDLVITSPPYPNNYDYADATRLEMSFMQEISGWSDLHDKVRQYLVRSCSQHTPEKNHNLAELLSIRELDSIRAEVQDVCSRLAEIRETKGGKKTYHLMVAAYFRDIAQVWFALRRVCKSPSKVCFVIGDSAPYGIYVPVVRWMALLSEAAGFDQCSFEKTRDRNIKWKNRKHQVPLKEGRFWVAG